MAKALVNFVPRGGLALPDFSGLFKKSSFKMADSRCRVKARTKAFFLEEILINIPLENLPRLSKERMQYLCHALKLNLKSWHSASASNCSMNRSARTEDDYQFSTAKNPLFNSTHICKVGDHWQEHRWAVQKGLPGFFPSRKRVMSAWKVLSVVNFVHVALCKFTNLVFFNHMQGE